MPVSNTLRKAAALIQFHGLAKGQFEDPIGQIDVQEALFRAATNTSQQFYAAQKRKGIEIITLDKHNKYRWAVVSLRNWLKDQNLEDQPALWSDNLTKEQVIDALLACADYKDAHS